MVVRALDPPPVVVRTTQNYHFFYVAPYFWLFLPGEREIVKLFRVLCEVALPADIVTLHF